MATKKKAASKKKSTSKNTTKGTAGFPPDEVYLIIDGEGAIVGAPFLDSDIANVIAGKLRPSRGPLNVLAFIQDRDVTEGSEG